MEETRQTKGEQHIRALMQTLSPESDRYRILASASQFKASWAELGERLVDVSQKSLFEEWGFNSFAEYCSRELRIRRATADKLLLAYRFLQKQEPGVLQRHQEHQPLPDYRSVDLLRRAHEEEEFTPDQYRDLRESVIEEERSLPTIRRQFQDVTRLREESAVARQRQARAALGAARRLQTALEPLAELTARHRPALDILITELSEVVEQENEAGETGRD